MAEPSESPAESPAPELSIIVLVREQRARAQHLLTVLGRQECLHSLELILVDLAPEAEAPLTAPEGLATVYLRLESGASFGRVRLEAVHAARGEVVALLEDHCYPEPDWASALIREYRRPWAALGYAFTNANPRSYLARCSFIADYGLWAHPHPTTPLRLLPGNNVSYRRGVLLELGDALATHLYPDYVLQEALRLQGLAIGLAGNARVTHENFEDVKSLIHADHNYCRLLAVNRARSQNWSAARRLIYAAGTPVGAPVVKFVRLLLSLRKRTSLIPQVLLALPVIALAYAAAAVGESLGYLLGPGDSERKFDHWELDATRVVRSP